MIKKKPYRTSEEDFNLYRSEVLRILDKLGLKVSIEFNLGLPDDSDFDQYVVAGLIMYEDNQKVLFFLNNMMKRRPRPEMLRYLAMHECLEYLLIQRFKNRTDPGDWEERVHDVIHRLISLVEPELLEE